MVRSRPIMTTAHCKKSFFREDEEGTYSESADTYDDSDDYVVLINTSHPQIMAQFDQAFRQAEQCINAGDNFRITVGDVKCRSIRQ